MSVTRLDDMREHLGADYPSVRELCDHAQALADALRRWAEDARPPELRAFDEWNEAR